jgi:excisionase family DNA binding protein
MREPSNTLTPSAVAQSTAPNLAELPDVLTVDETMRVLRIGRNNVYDRIRAGTIKSIRLGRRVLVPKAELLRLLGGA